MKSNFFYVVVFSFLIANVTLFPKYPSPDFSFKERLDKELKSFPFPLGEDGQLFQDYSESLSAQLQQPVLFSFNKVLFIFQCCLFEFSEPAHKNKAAIFILGGIKEVLFSTSYQPAVSPEYDRYLFLLNPF